MNVVSSFYSFLCVGSVAMSLAMAGCGGDQSKLEKASYALAKGGRENAQEALNLVAGLLDSSDLSIRFEAVRIYVGAQAALAGYDSTEIFSGFIYGSSDNPISKLRSEVTLSSDAEDRLNLAEAELVELSQVEGFSDRAERDRNGILVQLGIVRLLQAATMAILTSGLNDVAAEAASLDVEACIARFTVDSDRLTRIETMLSDSRSSFVTADLSDAGDDRTNSNILIRMVDEYTENLPENFTNDDDIRSFCEYLSRQ